MDRMRSRDKGLSIRLGTRLKHDNLSKKLLECDHYMTLRYAVFIQWTKKYSGFSDLCNSRVKSLKP